MTPSKNEELLIVLTDTETVDEDIALKEKLDTLDYLKLISLGQDIIHLKNKYSMSASL